MEGTVTSVKLTQAITSHLCSITRAAQTQRTVDKPVNQP